uniref:Hmgxb4 protein n=1 Tax=Phallusia mammillata TaxID=59560 RepID=A0A6F9DF37_9ASCI|nr:Hmgxb4 protein [Phallusia mammillata]
MRPPVVLVNAASRAEELPDEFILKNSSLYCKWCNKVITSLRKDNIVEHLHSKLHQDNRMEKGAPMSFDPRSPKMLRMKANRKTGRERRLKGISPNKEQHRRTPESDSQETATESDEEELKHIFNESDSEETESFEGFDESAVFDFSPKKRDSRVRKRPARLSDATDSQPGMKSPPAKKSKGGSSSDGLASPKSPFSIRSLPLKKQMSYSARVSNALSSAKPTKKGTLKIKISRKSREKSKSFHVESSGTEDTEQSNKRVAAAAKHGGLKMKFVIKNLADRGTQKLKTGRKYLKSKKNKRRKSAPAEVPSYDDDSTDVQQSPYAEPSAVEEVLQEEEVAEEQVVGNEVVEEEIVGVDEGEVVSWEDIAADEEDNFDDDVPESPLPEVEEITAEESLARKANHARKMAKSVNSAQFKKKRLSAAKKRQYIKQEDKDKKQRKASGYMLWSSKMRKQVATQYPGLQFGDVSKKLGDLWKRIPDKEKQMWKYRSVKMANQLEKMQSAPRKRKQGSKMIETGPRKRQVAAPRITQIKDYPLSPYPPHRNPEETMRRELSKLSPPSIEPIDAAAHFHLLGESLLAIGRKVRNAGNGSPMGGVIPTMLDSLLCALAPLMSLTNQIPELQGSIPEATLSGTLANIAHFIPSPSQSMKT